MLEVTLVELSLCSDDPAALAPRLLLQHLPGEIAGRDVQAIAGYLAIAWILCHACGKMLRTAFRYAPGALRRLGAKRARRPAKAGRRLDGPTPPTGTAAAKATIVTHEQAPVAPFFFSWQTGQVPLRANR